MAVLYEQIQKEREYLIRMRRDFHKHSELSLQEVRTAGVIEKELESFSIEYRRIGAPVLWGY